MERERKSEKKHQQTLHNKQPKMVQLRPCFDHIRKCVRHFSSSINVRIYISRESVAPFQSLFHWNAVQRNIFPSLIFPFYNVHNKVLSGILIVCGTACIDGVWLLWMQNIFITRILIPNKIYKATCFHFCTSHLSWFKEYRIFLTRLHFRHHISCNRTTLTCS